MEGEWMIHSGITTDTPKRLLFGAGVYFANVTYDEKIAPTLEAIKAALIGATQEGGTLTITPEFYTPPIDGALVPLMELRRKVGETAQMEVSFAEFTADLAAKMVIGKMSESTDGKYDVITSADLTAGHFYQGFGFYGNLFDGRPVIIIFKNALCTSGFTSNPKNKENAMFKGTFECHSDITYGTTRLPYAIFVHKADGWTPATADDLAA